ncbi:hypothetical protein KM043_004606 [Ampulex compressa]|nr:hypothetical protein KM043_004606 [Ampulex compressa]
MGGMSATEEGRNAGSTVSALDCRVGVGATVNDCLCRLHTGPRRKPGPYPPTRQWNSDYGLPPVAPLPGRDYWPDEKSFPRLNSAGMKREESARRDPECGLS